MFVFVCIHSKPNPPEKKPFVRRRCPDELVVSAFCFSPTPPLVPTSLPALLHLILSASIPEMAQIAAEAKLPIIKHLQ